jgi:negative regulator of flagellin synthesis FlgM
MRINPFSPETSQISSAVSSQSGTQRAAPVSATAGGISQGDRTTLTSDTRSLASLVSGALSSPEIRQGRVDGLRQAISNGEYRINPESVAAAMVGESS